MTSTSTLLIEPLHLGFLMPFHNSTSEDAQSLRFRDPLSYPCAVLTLCVVLLLLQNLTVLSQNALSPIPLLCHYLFLPLTCVPSWNSVLTRLCLLQVEFFSRFKKAYPAINVGLGAFKKLKPFYVWRLRERNTCACRYHVEILEMKTRYNNMRSGYKGIYGTGCTCDCDVYRDGGSTCCSAASTYFLGLTDMWSSILCPEDDGW